MALTNLFDIDIRCYISGVRIPVNSISITSKFNDLPTCSISTEPSPALYGIGRFDRVPLHVFVSNSFEGKNDEYLLMFDGEIAGFGYSNTPLGREFVIHGQSTFALLKDIAFDFTRNMPEFVSNAVAGRSLQLSVVVSSPDFMFPYSLFAKGIVGNTPIEYPSDFLENALSYIVSKEGKVGADKSQVGIFYGEKAQQRCLDKRWSRLPCIDDSSVFRSGFPMLEALQAEQAMAMMAKMGTDGPKTGNMFDLITYVASHLEYEFSTLNSPTGPGLKTLSLKPILYEAQPSRCNIVPRSLIYSLRCDESVYQVPTRIRTADTGNALNLLGDNSPLTQFGVVDYWPKDPKEPESADAHTKYIPGSSLLDVEQFTGPYAEDAAAPLWMSYMNLGDNLGKKKEFWNQVRAHLLLLRQYSPRRLSLGMAFSPFMTAGFPSVVFDNAGTTDPFIFVGQALVVTHTITKHKASTNVEMGFVREISEAVKDGKLTLTNSVPAVSDQITHDVSQMNKIYQELLGCNAVDLRDIKSLLNHPMQDDPMEAYKYTSRNISTQEEFINMYMPGKGLDINDFSGDSELFSKRQGGDAILDTLKAISKKVFATEIYS